MAPKQQQHATGRVSGNGTNTPTAGGGTKAPAGGGGRPGNGMNFFAALSGIADADALHDELEMEGKQRRQPSSQGTAAAADGRRSRSGEAGGMKQPLVWIDLEMTGLDVEKDAILQIAVICTDGSLEEVAEGPELAIHAGEEVLAGMNAWCVDQHGRSGLTQACRDSAVTLADAEQAVLQFVQRHAPEPGSAQIAGNSVHVDLAFLRRHMPRLADHLHYRIVDVSTVGELCRRWFPREHARTPKKKNTHTALSDIRESIQQLQYYRQHIFKRWSGANLP